MTRIYDVSSEFDKIYVSIKNRNPYSDGISYVFSDTEYNTAVSNTNNINELIEGIGDSYTKSTQYSIEKYIEKPSTAKTLIVSVHNDYLGSVRLVGMLYSDYEKFKDSTNESFLELNTLIDNNHDELTDLSIYQIEEYSEKTALTIGENGSISSQNNQQYIRVYDLSKFEVDNIFVDIRARNGYVNFYPYAFSDTDYETVVSSPKSANILEEGRSSLVALQTIYEYRGFLKKPSTAKVLITSTSLSNEPHDYIYFLLKDQVKYITGLSLKVDTLSEEIESLQEKYNYSNVARGTVILDSTEKILGIGASFMRGNETGENNNNTWLYLIGKILGVDTVNDALGSTNIMYHANRLYNGDILSESGNANINDIGCVLIMHSHEKDVFTLPEEFANYSSEDYETNGIVPFSETTGNYQQSVEYAKAFDYVIKKIKQLYIIRNSPKNM